MPGRRWRRRALSRHSTTSAVFQGVRQWNATRSDFPDEWRESSFVNTMLAYLTPDELSQVGDELLRDRERYRDRTLDKVSAPAGGCLPVSIVMRRATRCRRRRRGTETRLRRPAPLRFAGLLLAALDRTCSRYRERHTPPLKTRRRPR